MATSHSLPLFSGRPATISPAGPATGSRAVQRCRIVCSAAQVFGLAMPDGEPVSTSPGISLEPHRRAQLGLVGRAAGKIIERPLGDADDVMLDERRALGRPVLGMLEAALP